MTTREVRFTQLLIYVLVALTSDKLEANRFSCLTAINCPFVQYGTSIQFQLLLDREECLKEYSEGGMGWGATFSEVRLMARGRKACQALSLINLDICSMRTPLAELMCPMLLNGQCTAALCNGQRWC